jgi:hypothetical protein
VASTKKQDLAQIPTANGPQILLIRGANLATISLSLLTAEWLVSSVALKSHFAYKNQKTEASVAPYIPNQKFLRTLARDIEETKSTRTPGRHTMLPRCRATPHEAVKVSQRKFTLDIKELISIAVSENTLGKLPNPLQQSPDLQEAWFYALCQSRQLCCGM